MTTKEFDCERFKMKIGEALIKEIVVKRGKTFNEADLAESKRLSSEFLPNAKFFVLMEGEEDATVSTDAKRLAASKEYAQYTSALALCTSNLASRIMGNLFLKVNKPAVRTRMFETRGEALAWLHKQMALQKDP
jgi:hypothetical protein